MLKIVAAEMLKNVTERAMRVHGAMGLSDRTDLAGILVPAWTFGIGDGPSEVHLPTISKMEIRDHDSAAFCERIGADAVIDRKTQDVTATTRELTDGRGPTIVFDPVGGKPALAAFRATAFEGRFVVIGYASGEWARIPVEETLMMNISLVGAMPFGFSHAQFRAVHDDLVAHFSRGELDLSHTQVFEFEDARSAIECIATGGVEGKVVVWVRA